MEIILIYHIDRYHMYHNLNLICIMYISISVCHYVNVSLYQYIIILNRALEKCTYITYLLLHPSLQRVLWFFMGF